MKQKMLSKENEDDITRLEGLSCQLETRAGEEESTISCLKESITTIESSNEDSKKQIIKQSDSTIPSKYAINNIN